MLARVPLYTLCLYTIHQLSLGPHPLKHLTISTCTHEEQKKNQTFNLDLINVQPFIIFTFQYIPEEMY